MYDDKSKRAKMLFGGRGQEGLFEISRFTREIENAILISKQNEQICKTLAKRHRIGQTNSIEGCSNYFARLLTFPENMRTFELARPHHILLSRWALAWLDKSKQ
jgi:hypothetical protein